jgi:hypothetical protein
MEIKVNDYVRTRNGIIRKITEEYQFNEYGRFWFSIKENKKTENCNEYSMSIINKKDIVKHSNNIIDLIEEGDYVDGIKVKEIYFCGEKYEGLGVEKFGKYLLLNEIKFKSIVTKEQFSSLEYII